MRTRLQFIDATRALFVLQGVLYHSLLPFHEAKWSPVSNPEGIVGVAALTDWLHAFRMHGFFLISGILSWQLLCRVGTAPFLRSRLQRIVVPFVVVLLTANVVERLIVMQHHDDWGWGLTVVPKLYLGALWFLVYLACFTTFLPLARAMLQSARVGPALDGWSRRHSEYALLILLTLGSVFVVLLARTSPRWWQTDKLGLIFWMVSASFRTASTWSTAIVGASYTVYLLHQVVIKATASVLAWLPWHPLLKVPIIICFGFMLPFFAHHLFVKKSRWLSFLLNDVALPPARLEHAG